MVTMLDCIKRIPQILDGIIEDRKTNASRLLSGIADVKDTIDEIIFVGSGTSSTSALTARSFIERNAGIRASVYVPNDFCHNKKCLNPNALYVFTSQTGTSIETRNAMQLVKELGYSCLGITESQDTPLAKEASVHWNMGCGYEEYPMRTIGYSASVLCQMLIGLEIGLTKGTIDNAEYDALIRQAKQLPGSIESIIEKTLEWAEHSKWNMLRSQCLIFVGADTIYGAALEAALKSWEILQKPSIGYELEESLHGPNYGYDSNHCVIVLNDGERENSKALALGRYMEEVIGNGFVIGAQVAHDQDLKLDLKSGCFSALELMSAAQALIYRLTVDLGRDLLAPQNHAVMESYFKTHDEAAGVQ